MTKVDDVGVSKAKPGLEAAEFGFRHLCMQQLPVAVVRFPVRQVIERLSTLAWNHSDGYAAQYLA